MTLITFNNLSKADGSALIDEDGTIVQAAVFGPVDISQTKMNTEDAVIETLFKPKVNIPSSSSAFDTIRETEEILKHIFKDVVLTKLFPRTLVSIMVQEISNNGSLLSTAINAACYALIDAGLPMKSPVAAVSIKPSVEDDSCIEFVFDNNFDLITVITKGSFDEISLSSAIETGQREAKTLFDRIRDKVRDRFTG